MEESGSDVLLTTFTVNGKSCKVYFSNNNLIWEIGKKPKEHGIISIRDILNVKWNENELFFKLYYAKRYNNVWRSKQVTLHHQDNNQINLWIRTIKNYIEKLNRPKKILIFVNPYGGKRKALKIFDKYGKPIFKIADTDVTVMITQRSNQISDFIRNLNLTKYDALVCVGGDGTFSELFNALMIKTCEDNNLDPDDPNQQFLSPQVSLGIIPGGSTDTVAYCLHGTNDIQTAVIHIVFGETIGLDLASAHNENCLVTFYASIISYGFLGDVANESEKLRWMGPKRYDYSGFKKVLLNNGYEAELRLLLDSNNAEKKICVENCDRCSISDYKKLAESNISIFNEEISDQTKWKPVKGKFFMISGANVSCACAKTPNGFAPYCHLGDGSMEIILVRHTSFFNVIRMLIGLASQTKNITDYPFVDSYRVRAFEFHSKNEKASTSRSTSSVWNCDGEVVEEQHLFVRVHRQILKVFSRVPFPLMDVGYHINGKQDSIKTIYFK